IAAIVLLALTRPQVRHWRWAQWAPILLLGLSLAGMNGTYYAALARLPLGPAVTIQFLGPLILAATLSRRWRDAGWVGVAFVGVVALGLAHAHGGVAGLDPVGVALALASAAFWALYIVAGSQVSRVVPGHGGLAVAMMVGALVLLPVGAGGAWHAVGGLG